jgi:DNA-binding MarR family transcriptional regulator
MADLPNAVNVTIDCRSIMNDPADLIDLLAAESYAVGAAFRRHGDAFAVPTGQSQARWQVLRQASTGTFTVPQIARRLGVSRQNVQRIANALVAEELAQCRDNPDHKSSPHLVLTAAGRAVLQKLSTRARDYRALLARNCGDLDLATLLEQLKVLSAALARIEDDVEALPHAPAAAAGRDRQAG